MARSFKQRLTELALQVEPGTVLTDTYEVSMLYEVVVRYRCLIVKAKGNWFSCIRGQELLDWMLASSKDCPPSEEELRLWHFGAHLELMWHERRALDGHMYAIMDHEFDVMTEGKF